MEKKQMPALLLPLLGGIILGLLIGGFFAVGYHRQVMNLTSELQRMKTEAPPERAEEEQILEAQQASVALYFIIETDDESYLAPELRKVSSGDNLPVIAARELIAGPQRKELKPVLPSNTKVLGLEIEDGLAVINLSQAATRSSGGAWREALTVSAVVNTLTKFPEVEAVRILIEGKEVETLCGHVDLTHPLRRNDQVVRIEYLNNETEN